MHSSRAEIVASLQSVAQLHMGKAIAAATKSDFASKPANLQKELLDALTDTGASLGYFSRATLEVYGLSLETYLPGLLDQLDKLDSVCRAFGAPTNSYEQFREALL